MARRQQHSEFSDLHELLKTTPSWLGPVLALIAFVAIRFLLPLLTPATPKGVYDTHSLFRDLMPMFAWLAAGVILAAWIPAEIWKLFNRRLLDTQTGPASVREIPWPEFERLVSEAYRRQGYVAEVVDRPGGDGGIDIVLTRPGETVLVQCKQWRAFSVGVSTVRELLGVVVSERASRGIVVTSGKFTKEAWLFAAKNPAIELVDGSKLFALIRTVQSRPSEPSSAIPRQAAKEASRSPGCPTCGGGMKVKTARRGANPGRQFWSCARYPACKGTRPV